MRIYLSTNNSYSYSQLGRLAVDQVARISVIKCAAKGNHHVNYSTIITVLLLVNYSFAYRCTKIAELFSSIPEDRSKIGNCIR